MQGLLIMTQIEKLQRKITPLEKERDTYQDLFFTLMERYMNGEDKEDEERDYDDEEGD